MGKTKIFIKTISDDEATGEIAATFDAERETMGMVMEATRCWSARPDVLAPVEHFLHQLRDNFSLGLVNFRLITLIAAKHVPSSYCSHVYFRALSKALGREKTLAIQRDFRSAGLTDAEIAMLTYAEQIAIDASRITQADIDHLRAVGFSDVNIADIALAASYRSFMSRYFDAVGATAEAEFLDDDPDVRAQLAVGKA